MLSRTIIIMRNVMELPEKHNINTNLNSGDAAELFYMFSAELQDGY